MSDQQRPYHQEANQAERAEGLRNDKAQASTMFERAKSEVGAELGGRFRHLSKDQQIVGDRNIHLPGQRPESHWGGAFREGDEPPLGFSIEQVPSMETVHGGEREQPLPPETVSNPPTTIVIEQLTAEGFRRKF
jgi:hypothetical protein